MLLWVVWAFFGSQLSGLGLDDLGPQLEELRCWGFSLRMVFHPSGGWPGLDLLTRRHKVSLQQKRQPPKANTIHVSVTVH